MNDFSDVELQERGSYSGVDYGQFEIILRAKKLKRVPQASDEKRLNSMLNIRQASSNRTSL